jgi:hypothetical protein
MVEPKKIDPLLSVRSVLIRALVLIRLHRLTPLPMPRMPRMTAN